MSLMFDLPSSISNLALFRVIWMKVTYIVTRKRVYGREICYGKKKKERGRKIRELGLDRLRDGMSGKRYLKSNSALSTPLCGVVDLAH